MIDTDHNQNSGDSESPSLAKVQSLAHLISEKESMGASREMPRYRCHKQVYALKIKDIIDPTEPGNESDGSRLIVPADEGYGRFPVDADFVHKHQPHIGGYYVVYDDGYKSFSPAKAFEDGYTRI